VSRGPRVAGHLVEPGWARAGRTTPSGRTRIAIRVFGIECRGPSLRRLIAVERVAGRPKDLEAIAELEVLADEAKGSPGA
jgi:hypothetical protein